MSSSVFSRGRDLPVAVSANGSWVYDASGKAYLDAGGGAIVVGIGHGDEEMVSRLADQASKLDFVHAAAFTSAVLESYAAALAKLVPVDDARVFPVSGGSEAVETALKMARVYHLARGDGDRAVFIARGQSYHGSTRGALDLSGREPLRRPYLPWLGQTARVPGVNEFRCPNPGHPIGCAGFHADRLEETIQSVGAGRVAAFIAETVGGATSGAAVPPPGYWEAVTEVCRRHGVLVIADEVMTGFGRTGNWFACEHFGLRPDILVLGKGASSGYWPLGLTVTTGHVHDVIEKGGGLAHGFTWSHHPMGAAVGLAVLERIERDDLVTRAAETGASLLSALRSALGHHPRVGDVRGLGLLLTVELVADRETKRPFPRREQVTERIKAAAAHHGLLVYPSTGNVDGVDGDSVLLGPPLTITEEESALIVERLAHALEVLK